MKTVEESYYTASYQSLCDSSTETRQDVIHRAMKIHACNALDEFHIRLAKGPRIDPEVAKHIFDVIKQLKSELK